MRIGSHGFDGTVGVSKMHVFGSCPVDLSTIDAVNTTPFYYDGTSPLEILPSGFSLESSACNLDLSVQWNLLAQDRVTEVSSASGPFIPSADSVTIDFT